MSDPTKQGDEQEETPQTSTPVDLSELRNLSIGPQWDTTESARKIAKYESRTGESPRRSRLGTSASRDRRPVRAPGGRETRRTQGDQDRPPGRRPQRDEAPVFTPTVDVTFYPEEEPFRVLSKAIRNSYRTYELFQIARLILEKPERVVAVLHPRESGKGKGEGEARACLYQSVPDGFPFEREDEAVAHVFQHCVESFFDVEEVEVEPPSGSFRFINRCTITGELLGPPNYHRYQEFLQRHYTARIHNMPYERFLQRVESVADPEIVQQWLDQMKRGIRYEEKVEEGQEKQVFSSLEEARRHLLSTRKEDVVCAVESVRLSGRKIGELPDGSIKRSILSALEAQQRFPLETANHLRSRLRRMRFHIYKKGSKGVTFICAVKRRFREPGVVLADSAQGLIDFIEANPMLPASELPEKYLGLKPVQVEVPLPAANPVSEELPAEKEESAVAAEGEENTAERDDAAPPAPQEAPQQVRIVERLPDTPELRRLKQDLHWLVSEGFVTEYGDGRLFAHPVLPPSKPKASPESRSREKEQLPAGSPSQGDSLSEEKEVAQSGEDSETSSLPDPAVKDGTGQEEETPEERLESKADPAPPSDQTPEEKDSATAPEGDGEEKEKPEFNGASTGMKQAEEETRPPAEGEASEKTDLPEATTAGEDGSRQMDEPEAEPETERKDSPIPASLGKEKTD